MTDDGDRPKDPRPDPFAPLPLQTSLLTASGKTQLPPVAPVAPEPITPPPPEPAGFATPADPPTDPRFGPAPENLDAAPVEPNAPASPPEPEPPLLPATYSENDLRSAVGATLRPEEEVTTPEDTKGKKARRKAKRPPPSDSDDSDDGGRPRSRLMMVVGVLTLLFGGGITALVFLGRANAERYEIACEADRVVVMRGRAFPPWGTSTLDGAEWKAVKIPPEAECHPRETHEPSELAQWYFKILTDRAAAELKASHVDEAEAQLKQALLVARSLGTDDARTDARNDVERLLGDVGYWHASAKLRSASDALTEAAKQFDVAATQRPRYATDAAMWAKHVRALVEQLRAGPGGVQATFPPLPPTERPTAPPGVALPVEPDTGSAAGSAEPPTAPPPDAAMPSGGVLL